jgi:hypothetical protein
MQPHSPKQQPEALCILGGHAIIKPSRIAMISIAIASLCALPIIHLFKFIDPSITTHEAMGLFAASVGCALCVTTGLRFERGAVHTLVIVVFAWVSYLFGDTIGRLLF